MNQTPDLITELREIPWLEELDDKHLENLVSIAHVRTVGAAEELFREGGIEQFMYIVLDGRIALEMFVPNRGRVRIFTVEPTEIVGWSCVMPVAHRIATAKAVLPSRLMAFEGQKLRELCDADHELGYFLMLHLATVITQRLMVTRLQLLDMFAHPSPQEVI